MKKLSINILLSSLLTILMSSCADKHNVQTISVFNDLTLERKNETVVLKKTTLDNGLQQHFNSLVITEVVSSEVIPSQKVDLDEDGNLDAILFQPNLDAGQKEKLYTIRKKASDDSIEMDTIAYARFVPERLDDYAWENDKVAFRVYGPKAREWSKKGLKDGVNTSGIDCWLKRVNYPIIDKWYQGFVSGTANYHKDTGEGLDNYYVGTSLGCGGLGVLSDTLLFTSGNYHDYKQLSNGPIRTNFKLYYNPWNAGDVKVSQVNTISLDKGSNLTRYKVKFDKNIKEVVVGLPLIQQIKEKDVGEAKQWVGVWQDQQDAKLGLGIVVDPAYVIDTLEFTSLQKDKSHVFIKLKPIDNAISYYAGFGWSKSGQFNTHSDWFSYLDNFSQKLNSPLRIKVNSSK